VSAPTRTPPKRILLYLPASRPLTGRVTGVTVVTRPDQKVRWDFPTVFRKYLSSQKPKATP